MELEDTEIVVVCELCNNKTPNFNRHMRTHHPGCGGKTLFSHVQPCSAKTNT